MDWRIKEAVITILGSIAESILAQKDIKEMMEQMMMHHILHELNSPVPYMKWRTLWFYSQYEDLSLQDQGHLH